MTDRIAPHLAALSALLAQDADAGRLNTRHIQLLAMLADRTEPLSVIAAAQILDVSQSSASRMIERLVVLGLVSRTDNPADRRTVSLCPTDAGRQVVCRVQQHVAAAHLIPGAALTNHSRTHTP